jgi:GxxExxY protein
MNKLVREDLLYPELSYQIIGCAYDIYNELGPVHQEKYYQRALAQILKQRNIPFEEQVYSPLKFQGKVIGKLFLDFLIEKKVIVELKKGNYYSKRHIDQVLEYLRTSNLQLAIIINFGSDKVSYKRIVNLLK